MRTVRTVSSRPFFLLLLTGAALASAYLVFPLVPELLFAAVLAAAGSPLYERLTMRLGGHREVSAVLFTLLFVLVVLAPVLLATVSAVGDVVEVTQSLTRKLDEEGLAGLLAVVPEPVRVRLANVQLDQMAWQERIGAASGRVIAVTGGFLKATGNAMFSLAMLLIALVVFLVEGKRIIAWLDDVVPLERGQLGELLGEFKLIGNSVLIGNFGTSAIQALVALVGYLIARAPSPLVITLLTFVLSFVPAIGGAGVGLVTAGLLALMGRPWSALFLAIWAVAVVGVIDNVVKPMLVKRGAKLHGALVFFAIISGILVFGASGLLLGPIIVTFALTLLRIYGRDFKGGVTTSGETATDVEGSSLPDPLSETAETERGKKGLEGVRSTT